MDTILDKIRSAVLSTLAVLGILLVILLLLSLGKTSGTATTYTGYDSANAVTVALSAMAAQATATVNSSMEATSNALRTFGTATVSGITTIGRTIAMSLTHMANTIWQNLLFAVRFIGRCNIVLLRAIGSCFVFIGHAVSAGFGMLGDAPSVNAMIRPSSATTLPTIDAALTAAQPVEKLGQTAQPTNTAPSASAWPLHGSVTAHFGAPHWPYQPVHTGIDISSGQRSGVMPIKPFRAGVIVETIHSRYGLGNHVVVDHGNGVTSTYAHLYNIVVQAGQAVGADTTLGHEGSTGVSTGPHLHFEIRKDGNLQNPHEYIVGNP